MTVPAVMAVRAHQNVSPMLMVTPPSTRLNTLTLAPHQKASWCHGLPWRALAGMYSMWWVSAHLRVLALCLSAELGIAACLSRGAVIRGQGLVRLGLGGDEGGGLLGDGQDGGV